MHPSCLVPAVQACGGIVMIWGLVSAQLCAQIKRSADYLNKCYDQIFPSVDFPSPDDNSSSSH